MSQAIAKTSCFQAEPAIDRESLGLALTPEQEVVAPLSDRVRVGNYGLKPELSSELQTPPRRAMKARGKRSRFSSGGTLSSQLEKGPRLAPNLTKYTSTPPIPLPCAPITEHAEVLLKQFHRRHAFWWLVEEQHYSVELAGSIYLVVAKRQAETVYKELIEAGGPYLWFRRATIDGIRTRKIGLGRETIGSRVADAFYTALAGGKDGVAELETLGYQGNTRQPLELARERLGGIDLEIVEYMAYRHIHDKASGKRPAKTTKKKGGSK